METPLRSIAARSRRRAMDWSLVLASQEIEATITQENGWELLVAESDFARAENAISLYERENRGWNWKQKLPLTGLIFHWGSLVPCLVLVGFFIISQAPASSLRSNGLMDNVAVMRGEWWRIFTAICLHADASHLMANLTTGLIFFGMAMALAGPGRGLLAAYLAGAGGNLIGLLFYPEFHRSLGASGMIMGALGVISVESVAAWRTIRLKRIMARGVAAGVLVLVLMGFGEGTDILAHVGGFFCGALLGVILHSAPIRFAGKMADAVAIVILASMTILTWWLAFRKV